MKNVLRVCEKMGFISESIQIRDQNESIYNYEDLKYNLDTYNNKFDRRNQNLFIYIFYKQNSNKIKRELKRNRGGERKRERATTLAHFDLSNSDFSRSSTLKKKLKILTLSHIIRIIETLISLHISKF